MTDGASTEMCFRYLVAPTKQDTKVQEWAIVTTDSDKNQSTSYLWKYWMGHGLRFYYIRHLTGSLNLEAMSLKSVFSRIPISSTFEPLEIIP